MLGESNKSPKLIPPPWYIKIKPELIDPPWHIKIDSEDDNFENVVSESTSNEQIPSIDSVITTNRGAISEEYNIPPEMSFSQKGTVETNMDNNDNSLDRDERRRIDSEKSRRALEEAIGVVPSPRTSPSNIPESRYNQSQSSFVRPVMPEQLLPNYVSTYNQVEPAVPMQQIWHQGVTVEDARKLNYQYLQSGMNFADKIRNINANVDEKIKLAMIDVNKDSALKSRAYEYELQMRALKQEGSVSLGSLDMQNELRNFINEKRILSEYNEYGNKDKFYIGKGKIGHIVIPETELKKVLETFWREKIVFYYGEEIKLNDTWNKFLTLIPCLGTDDCNWKILEQTKVVFQNGIYDLKTGLFEELTGSTSIFTLDAIRTNFIKSDWQEFLKFDEMLSDIFDNDTNKIILVYQMIGAILSNVALKNIFVFQGISGGGKTALAEIICRLLGEGKYLPLMDMPDINNYSKKELMPYKLIFIQDAANKPITSKQDSIFKTYSGGSQLKGMSNFKILICTNHAIYTSQDQGQKLLSRALSQRLVIVPFTKPMDKSTARVNAVDYMENDLDQEKELILSRAMMWFSEYFQLGANKTPQYKFHYEYYPNEFIDENVEVDY